MLNVQNFELLTCILNILKTEIIGFGKTKINYIIHMGVCFGSKFCFRFRLEKLNLGGCRLSLKSNWLQFLNVELVTPLLSPKVI